MDYIKNHQIEINELVSSTKELFDDFSSTQDQDQEKVIKLITTQTNKLRVFLDEIEKISQKIENPNLQNYYYQLRTQVSIFESQYSDLLKLQKGTLTETEFETETETEKEKEKEKEKKFDNKLHEGDQEEEEQEHDQEEEEEQEQEQYLVNQLLPSSEENEFEQNNNHFAPNKNENSIFNNLKTDLENPNNNHNLTIRKTGNIQLTHSLDLLAFKNDEKIEEKIKKILISKESKKELYKLEAKKKKNKERERDDKQSSDLSSSYIKLVAKYFEFKLPFLSNE
ncbi:hypothetical protein M0813_17452 [Anaeramoeba flamelloides]|uniref:Uncharacterized protein n=1 Tax=Anaeramoeba flamelloides TaxID=1746091 RepID=A0ABQ8YVL2_9EUKA|nr:hypothetical protein M0813_17452 [Anaeramoeba flamelloides]